MMYTYIRTLLQKENIRYVSQIPLSECRIIRPYMLEHAGLGKASETGSAIIFAVPYYPVDYIPGNISVYASACDYHNYFRQLFSRLIDELSEKFPKYIFAGFSDSSPIDERDAAARAGLGVIGLNSLLITELYSSYVFLGEIITDASCDVHGQSPRMCRQCGACMRSCPAKRDKHECLSSLTQKKGELSETETDIIRNNGMVWGCDICQRVCPYTLEAINKGSIYSDIVYFNENIISSVDTQSLRNMSDLEFSGRAFSWRGRQPIQRNAEIIAHDTGVENERKTDKC